MREGDPEANTEFKRGEAPVSVSDIQEVVTAAALSLKSSS